MRKLFIVGLFLISTSALAMKSTSDHYGKTDVLIVAAECSDTGSSITIMDQNERKRLTTDNSVCTELDAHHAAALNCTAVKADLTLSNSELLFGYLTMIRVTGIANVVDQTGPCL